MAVVRTTKGTLLSGGKSAGTRTVPFTDEEAATVASSANDRAAALGLQTRYEVAPK